MDSKLWGLRGNFGHADHGAHTLTGLDLLIDPAPIAHQGSLVVTGTGVRAGRPVVLVRWKLSPESPRFPGHHQARAVDECEFEVDEERGLLLRLALRFDGDKLEVTEVLDIRFDEALPSHLFTFECPVGQKVKAMPRTFPVSIEDAVELVPFRLFILPNVPDDWGSMSVTYSSEVGHPPGVPSVSISYEWPRFPPLRMEQTTRPRCSPLGCQPRLVEREGQQFLVTRGSGSGWGTRVDSSYSGTIVSFEAPVDDETLLDLAASVAPAPTTAPRLVNVSLGR